MRALRFLRGISGAVATALVALPVLAVTADLSTTPLVTGTAKPIAPNVFFVLDDSSSMSWEYVPDSVAADATKNCFKNAGYNKMYYDPTVTYLPPVQTVNADGTTTDFANANFSSAKDDGFCTSNCATSDLRSEFRAFVRGGSQAPFITATSDPEQQAYYYSYNSGTAPATCAANSSYTRVRVTAGTAQATNFANWYSFYRTRINMTKSATGAAFKVVGDKFRVGFTVLSQPATPANSNDFLPIAKFTAQQKQTWFANLYAAGCPSGCGTPTRAALAKAGRLFAGQLVSATNPDPVQYSCQKNFAVLVTDGYWNTGSPETTACSGSSMYGPCMITSGQVGDQDGVAGTARPYLDSLPSSNSLSDIAMYYWKTDLRPNPGTGGLTDENTYVDVSADNVPINNADTATWQHMNTFAVGLGVPGVLNAESYLTGGSKDYNAIVQGTKNWPNPQTGSSTQSVPARLDDLWHAAVNGRGQYLNVKTPSALTAALNSALSAIQARDGAAAAAATSNLEPVAGDNFAYVAQYTTVKWYGDLQARAIDLISGAVSETSLWSAGTQLQGMVSASSDTRTLYTYDAGSSNKLKAFTAANLASEIAANHFKSSPANPNGALSQYGGFSGSQQAAATDAAMINYLRGQYGYEMSTSNATQLFRERLTVAGSRAVLGDIVSTKPVFVRVPPFKYVDTGFAAFAVAQANRAGRVYAAANDGMLHAFDAATGNEAWSYIPGILIPQLYKLADAAYATNHQFYVDGPLVAGDAYNGSAWRTILVGGLGRGGRGYYALDITDPASPKALWEFGTAQDANIGYSYGNPVLTKRVSDGKWVVLVASGYNNGTTSPADGRARLYVLDAFTGAKLAEYYTNTSTDPNANGLAKIANWVDETLLDNTTQYVYGGDLSGNLWRFDITATTGTSALRLGYTSLTPGDQPITMRPELGRVKDASNVPHKVVYFGTGRYLGFSDLTPTAPSQAVAQSIYAVKDTGADLGPLRVSGANLVAQTLNSSNSPRTMATPAAVNWATQNGWYVDTPVGERMTIDPTLQLGTLAIASNLPDTNYCTVGGTSWLYMLNYATGGPVSTASAGAGGQQIVGTFTGNALAVGVSVVQLPDGKVVAIVTTSDTKVTTVSLPIAPPGIPVRRVGWRELN